MSHSTDWKNGSNENRALGARLPELIGSGSDLVGHDNEKTHFCRGRRDFVKRSLLSGLAAGLQLAMPGQVNAGRAESMRQCRSLFRECDESRSLVDFMTPLERADFRQGAARLNLAGVFDRAIATFSGRRIVVPEGVARIGRPIVFRSGLSIVGMGIKSIILWDGSDSAGTGGNLCVLFGSMDYSALGSAKYCRVRPTWAGASSVTAAAASDAGHFSPGDIVWLWSGEGTRSPADVGFKPEFQQVTQVVAIDRENGHIFLRDQLYRAYRGDRLRISRPASAKSGPFTGPFMTHDIEFGNLRLIGRTATDSWSRYGGSYRAHVHDLWIDETDGAFVFNAMAHSRFERIVANVRKVGVDCAYFNHDTVLSGFRIRAKQGSAFRPRKTWGVVFAENCHDNTIDDLVADFGDLCGAAEAGAAVIDHYLGAKNNRTTNSNVRANGCAVLVRGNGADGSATQWGNVVEDSNFTVGEANHVFQNTGANEKSIAELTVRGNAVRIKSRVTGSVWRSSATGLQVYDNYIDAPSGNIVSDTSGKGGCFANNNLTFKPRVVSMKGANRVEGNKTVRAVRGDG